MTDSSTSNTKPVAVVVPCQRLRDESDVDTAGSLAASSCDHATATEHQTEASSFTPGHEKVSDDRPWCSGSSEDEAARLNEAVVDRRTSTCTVKPSRRVVQPQDDDDDDLTSCQFYHGNITSDEAKRRLASTSVGTYLLRDSQSPCFPFSLSIRNCSRSGVTSLRIAREGSGFRLDCDETHRAMMPKFAGVLRLVRHFVAESDGGEGGRCVLVGSSTPQSNEQMLTLRQPLHRPTTDNN